MDETKATARLPGLDIELTRRVDAEAGAEYVSVTLRAVPSLAAFAAALQPAVFNPFAVQMALWQSWVDMARSFWQPCLPAPGEPPSLPKRSQP